MRWSGKAQGRAHLKAEYGREGLLDGVQVLYGLRFRCPRFIGGFGAGSYRRQASSSSSGPISVTSLTDAPLREMA